jgi:hypothetical protein
VAAAEAAPASDEDGDSSDEDEAAQEGGPTQLHIAVSLHNAGDTPFEFQIASVANFAVRDLVHHAHSVRLVGLGNRTALDLSRPLEPKVMYNDMEFTYPLTQPGARCRRAFQG